MVKVMTEEVNKPKKKAGRPVGSKDKPKGKVKLKPNPITAKHDYKKKYGDMGFTAIYGFDSFTEELVRFLWSDPQHEFTATDPNEAKLANFTRNIGSLPWSMYRWGQVSHVGFIEEGLFPVVVVAAEYWEEVSKLPNPHKVKLICLSHWEK